MPLSISARAELRGRSDLGAQRGREGGEARHPAKARARDVLAPDGGADVSRDGARSLASATGARACRGRRRRRGGEEKGAGGEEGDGDGNSQKGSWNKTASRTG